MLTAFCGGVSVDETAGGVSAVAVLDGVSGPNDSGMVPAASALPTVQFGKSAGAAATGTNVTLFNRVSGSGSNVQVIAGNVAVISKAKHEIR
jgi:hypothetical protein